MSKLEDDHFGLDGSFQGNKKYAKSAHLQGSILCTHECVYCVDDLLLVFVFYWIETQMISRSLHFVIKLQKWSYYMQLKKGRKETLKTYFDYF